MTADTTTETPDTIDQLPTPALVVDREIYTRNKASMDAVRPGLELRPHVKAFKSTAMAADLAADGHTGFCAATPKEIEGLVAAGLTDDLLLANQTLDAARLGRLSDQAQITVAIDSDETLKAAVDGGVRNVLIDVEVGMPRCGCDVAEAGPLADRARAAGLEVRGVMGYEGHLMMVTERDKKEHLVEKSMTQLLTAHEAVGGDIVSGGGTGTYDINTWITELQAGSYLLLDTDYARLGQPFETSLTVVATVISVSPKGWAVVDAGLKAFGVDHGNPTWPDGEVMFCADEHTSLVIDDDSPTLAVGDRVQLVPAHVDPTVARHEQFWIAEGDSVVDRWDIDLRHW